VTAWDFDAWAALSTGYVKLVRHAQALTALPSALNTLATTRLLLGNFASAAALFEEAGAAGSQLPSYGTAVLAAWQGRDARAAALIDATVKRAVAQGDGTAVAAMHWATAVLCNALGLYEDALAAAEQASRHPHDMWASLAWPELIEAAIRSGQAARAGGALRHLSEAARASGAAWALGMEARSRALLSEGEAAGQLYQKAITLLSGTRVRAELGRAYLVYGEWLRRSRRRSDARTQLRRAADMFTEAGMEAFARRAHAELRAAAGTSSGSPPTAAPIDLTPQEAHVAGLAADGATNAEIAARLFISVPTVEYHLHKVFRKFGIASRTQLARRILPDT
jgi:DNA-binding CsgD family transcriptional regulator